MSLKSGDIAEIVLTNPRPIYGMKLVFIGKVQDIYLFYYYEEDMLMKPFNKDKLIMQFNKRVFNVTETYGHIDIEEWYIKNRLLNSTLPDIDEYELKDENIYERKPKVGRQYLKVDRSLTSYALYLGYKWFIVSEYPLTEAYLRSDSNFRIVYGPTITKKYVKGFQIKISDYPNIEEQLKRTKKKAKMAMTMY